MEYMFLMYADEEANARATPEENLRKYERQFAIMDDARTRGVLRGVSPLAHSSTSVTVRNEGSRRTFTDGPFTETKEALAGFYLIDCKDAEEARHWADRIVQTGCVNVVEFRALRELPTREALHSAAMANA